MKEVSCRIFEILFKALDREGIPHERLVENSKFSVNYLLNHRNRIDWDEFVILMKQFSDLMGGPPGLERAGFKSFDIDVYKIVGKLTGYISNAHQIYWIMHKYFMNSGFNNVTSTFENLADKRIRMIAEIPKQYCECEGFFWISKGSLRMLPMIIGQPEAKVEAKITPRKGVFIITPPPSLTILARIRRMLSITGAKQTAIEELGIKQQELNDSYEQLKKVHDNLAESEERYSTLFDSTFSGMVVHENGIILEANAAAAEMLGYSSGEILGRSVLDFLVPSSRETVIPKLQSDKDYNYVVESAKKDGTEVYLEIVSKGYIYDGRPVRIAALRDITRRKIMEEQLAKAYKLESLSLVAGGIAHDFRNLLAANLANIDMAQNYSNGNGVFITRTNKARQAASQARDLTDKLLSFSIKGTPVKNQTSLAALIKESADFCLTGSNIKCVTGISEDIWYSEVDESQIHQVVQNLIINASEAMASGGIVKIEAKNTEIATPKLDRGHPFAEGMSPMKIMARNDSDFDGLQLPEGRYVLIKIIDKGCGMSKEMQTKIFDPFFTTKENTTGLGLTTAHSIINRHDGHILVDSEEGKGSVFSVYLPAVKNACHPDTEFVEVEGSDVDPSFVSLPQNDNIAGHPKP